VGLEIKMITIRPELVSDVPARERLLNKAFGLMRFRKTSERLREGRRPAEGLAFAAVDETDKLIGTIRLWNIIAGSAGPSLLLGPLAVDCKRQGAGLGRDLMIGALAAAERLGHDSVLLVGDAPYYQRFGFDLKHTRSLHLPGPVERERFLGLELTPGALDGAEGLVSASGALAVRDGQQVAA
jgi:predicted N-acetyltransferase YhbS